MIFHGHTATSKILFIDCLLGVKAYLDDNPDTYPIILSLENHCSHGMQEIMAKNLKDTFGDKLYVPPGDELAVLPSPEELKGMIVIKGKRPPAPDKTTLDEEPEDDAVSSNEADTTGAGEENDPNAPPPPPPKLFAELAELTLFHGAKFKTFEQSIQMSANHMHSIGETKIPKLIESSTEQAKMWRAYNAEHLTRTYPAGFRVDSSNYNPTLAWSTGCQLVALNFQTNDAPLLLNDGRFREQAYSGYLLKPPRIQGTVHELGEPIQLKIKIISGTCIPKPDGATSGEIIDPYIQLSTHDVKEGDNGYEYVSESITTEYVDDNGFYPGRCSSQYQCSAAMVTYICSHPLPPPFSLLNLFQSGTKRWNSQSIAPTLPLFTST